MADSQITLCLVKKARLARPPRIIVYLIVLEEEWNYSNRR